MTGTDAQAAPEVPHPSWRRRRYVVDARYQLRSGILIGTVTIALLFILNLSLFTRDRREVERSPAHRADGVSWVLLVTGSAVFLAGVLAIGILESHRTAGAAYSIRRAVDQLREGRRGVRVRLRRRDNLQDLARSINELAEVLDNERPPRS